MLYSIYWNDLWGRFIASVLSFWSLRVVLETNIWQFQWNLEAKASFEEEAVVNYAQACDGKIILLFEMAGTHDRTAFRCRCKVSPPHLHEWHPCVHRPIPFLVGETDNLMPWQFSVCAARTTQQFTSMDTGEKQEKKLLLANNLADRRTQLSHVLDYNHYHWIRAAHYDILCTGHCKKLLCIPPILCGVVVNKINASQKSKKKRFSLGFLAHVFKKNHNTLNPALSFKMVRWTRSSLKI